MDQTAFETFLAACKGKILIACDTEFEGPHTLTIQFATRIGDCVVVQAYHSPDVSAPPNELVTSHARSCMPNQRLPLEILPIKPITKSLSPARVVADLFSLVETTPLSRTEQSKVWLIVPKQSIDLTLAAHFWSADFFRSFGSQFFAELLLNQEPSASRIHVDSSSVLAYRETGPGIPRFRPPVLGYLRFQHKATPVSVRTFDTSKAFGKASLDRLARTFLGIAKPDDISDAEKSRMTQTFLQRPVEAFAYAVLDAALTLRVAERMQEVGSGSYAALGLDEKQGPIRRTLGSRVADMMTQTVAKRSAAGSVKLSRLGRPLKNGATGAVSLAKVKELMGRGTSAYVTGKIRSEFGVQTGDTHGGLTFSRSPTQFFHAGPGMFRDVDLSGCYNAILSKMKMYLGRPQIHEPGAERMTLRQAIEQFQPVAAGRDAWIIKVSGSITKSPNVLIPSTEAGLTHANYRLRRSSERAARRRTGLTFDSQAHSRRQKGYARLYTDVVESGIVAWPTWLMIRALPKAIRLEYEQLEVETVLFYPERLVARSGPEYDRLVEDWGVDGPEWRQRFDTETYGQNSERRPDQESVSLEFNVGELAARFGQLRREAKNDPRSNSGVEAAWKLHANAMYGACACPYFDTNNVVAANVVTATARALAFAMQMSLNGFQIITDGCTYRRDEVPAGTFADCLAASPEYPIQRAGCSPPYLDPAEIPQDDAEFTRWYRLHVLGYFGVAGPEYEELFGLHQLEHKRVGPDRSPVFDGLLCDGTANYAKVQCAGEGWRVAEIKARSFSESAKEALTPWLLQTYASDTYVKPPPVCEMTESVTYKKAVERVQVALRQRQLGPAASDPSSSPRQMWFPLGLDGLRIATYKVIKTSNFLYRTPSQRKKICKAMETFAQDHACGLELLALRRSSAERRKGSIADVAEQIYRYIRSGGENLSKKFNLSRDDTALADLVQRRKRLAFGDFIACIDRISMPESLQLTGLFLQESDLHRVQR